MSEKSVESDINTHVVAVFAWIEKGGMYLLAQRSVDDPQAGGLWSLVGGKVDNDMGNGVIEETLRREIREEVGIEVTDEFDFLTSQGFIRVSGHHVISLIFKATYLSGEAQPLDGQEQVKWMAKAEIEGLISNDNRIGYLRNSFNRLES
jgi:8-oxo-dGTP diphosphatase